MEYWMFIIIFLFIGIIGSIGTSNKPPFKTEQVKEIWQNLTKEERKTANNKSLTYGVTVGAILGFVPLTIGLTLGAALFDSALNGVIAGIFLFPVVFWILLKKMKPRMAESWRDFFASTEWAKDNNIKPENIRLFEWEK